MNQNNEETIDLDEMIFLSILYSFHASAMQSMGKVVNPMTGKTERNLEAARGSIDAMLMLQKKTQGNLSEREDGTLKQIINELQLNFLEESKKPVEETDEKPEADEPIAAEGETLPRDEEKAETDDDNSEDSPEEEAEENKS